MSSSAQVFADLQSPIDPSHTVSFFRSLPRWPSADTNFAFDTTYLTGNALSALIPIIAGIALLLLTLLHILIRHTCRSSTTDARAVKLARSSPISRVQSVVSALLVLAIAVFLSLGLLGNAALTFSASDAVDAIKGVVGAMSRLGFAFADTILLFEGRLASFDPLAAAPLPGAVATSLGDVVSPTLDSLRQYALDAFPDVAPLRASLDQLVTSITDVLETVDRITDIVYAVILVLLLVLALTPLLLFLSDALARRKRRCLRVLPHLLFLLPILLAWVLVGVSQSVGLVLSDVCVSLHDYRTVLLTTSGSSSNSAAPVSSPSIGDNAFVDSGFTCPTAIGGQDIQQQIQDTARGVVRSQLARGTVELLLDEEAQRVADAAEWSGMQAARIANCSVQVEFSGALEFVACASEGQSAIQGVYDLFIAFLGLAIALHVALFVGLCGFGVASFLFVWGQDPIGLVDDDRYDDSSGSAQGAKHAQVGANDVSSSGNELSRDKVTASAVP